MINFSAYKLLNLILKNTSIEVPPVFNNTLKILTNKNIFNFAFKHLPLLIETCYLQASVYKGEFTFLHFYFYIVRDYDVKIRFSEYGDFFSEYTFFKKAISEKSSFIFYSCIFL